LFISKLIENNHEEKDMNVYTYETLSQAFELSTVEVVIIIAQNREEADKAMLSDPDCWLIDADHLNSVYQVEEKPLDTHKVLFRGKVLERLDPHKYS
jgi:hypothetical protein